MLEPLFTKYWEVGSTWRLQGWLVGGRLHDGRDVWLLGHTNLSEPGRIFHGSFIRFANIGSVPSLNRLALSLLSG